MNRRHGVVAAAVVVIAALVLWWRHGATSSATTATTGSAGSAAAITAAAAAPHADPRKLTRASIHGTIRDEAGAAIGHARVCVDASSPQLPGELTREPRCTDSDDHGTYGVDNLYAATYVIGAMAKPYQPGTYHPGGDRHESELRVAAGERKDGIDVVLAKGGAEVTGVVSDVSGGPIAHAQVRSRGGWWQDAPPGPVVDTDEQGRFSLWLRPGRVEVGATADGYAPGSDSGQAPGKLEILLTPESSLAGIVLDEKGQPVEGAHVDVEAAEWSDASGALDDITDADGHFRVTRIGPGRYSATARTEHGYGRTEGSTLVGLGQHVGGVTIHLFPAHRIEGKVVVASTHTPCRDGQVSFREGQDRRWLQTKRDADGTIHADGVLPGTYSAQVSCRGYQARDHYDPITIADKDATGLVWEVDAGATLRGKVVTHSGEPIEGASLWARTTGGAARAKMAWGGDTSAHDGSYELLGLKAGDYTIDVDTDRGVAPKDGYKVELTAGTELKRDLVLDDGGTIRGAIVDADGHPVVRISVRATGVDRGWAGNATSDETGGFTMNAVRAGDYFVSAARGWNDDLRKPGTTDDAKQGERVTVRPGETAAVKLVVEPQTGTITGNVTGTDGNAVSDAFVSAGRESDAAGAQGSSVPQTRWTWDERPVLTATDGTFTLTKLSPGNYTVRAYRKGGGEAVAEHVAVGSKTTLQIKPTGSIEGAVTRAGGVPDELDVEVIDRTIGFSRSESFFKTGGKIAVHDLPAGHFTVRVQADGCAKSVTIDLGEGEAKTGVAIELESLVTLTGRVVEYVTKQAVPGIMMMASPSTGGGMSFSFGGDDGQANITDETGAFSIKNAPRGPVSIRGLPKDFGNSDYATIRTSRTIDPNGPTTVDLGDIPTLKRRVKLGEPVGELGIHFADPPPGSSPDPRIYKVSFIDPAGPAAKTEIKVGDVLVSVDGVDITGTNSGYASTLFRAPPGTKLALGLQRKVTISVILAAP